MKLVVHDHYRLFGSEGVHITPHEVTPGDVLILGRESDDADPVGDGEQLVPLLDVRMAARAYRVVVKEDGLEGVELKGDKEGKEFAARVNSPCILTSGDGLQPSTIRLKR